MTNTTLADTFTLFFVDDDGNEVAMFSSASEQSIAGACKAAESLYPEQKWGYRKNFFQKYVK